MAVTAYVLITTANKDVVYIVRPRRRGIGCFIVTAFLLGIVVTLLLMIVLAEHSSG